MTPSILLAPLSWLYGAAVAARNACYDNGIFKSEGVATPVISVGNIEAGGTGKTPLVEAIVAILLDAGIAPAVLSRGYRRTSSGAVTVSDGRTLLADADASGDEPAQIARKFPRCAVVVDADRVRGARYIESTFRPGAIVLDDGFQHRALRRDLDIVVVGGTKEALLPAGKGREPEGSLQRAGFIVLSGGREALPPAAAGKPFARMRHEIARFTGPGGAITPDRLAMEGCVAFCGIGNPRSFAGSLETAGIRPAELVTFPDHRRYDPGDLARVEDARRRAGAAWVVTTEKDALRLSGPAMPRAPFNGALVTAELRAAIVEGRGALEDAVLRAAGRAAA